MKYRTIALIMAAGNGERFAATKSCKVPKQYTRINDTAILTIAIDRFLSHPQIDGVMVVIHDKHKKLYEDAVTAFHLLPSVIGGERRQDSVRFGLNALKHFSPENVLIHDAARIFVKPAQISESIKALEKYDAVTLGSRIVDSLRYDDEKGTTVTRDNLFAIQTPQTFKYKSILKWHEEMKDKKFTDDISLAEHAGCKHIKIIESSIENFKITTQDDLEITKLLISS